MTNREGEARAEEMAVLRSLVVKWGDPTLRKVIGASEQE